MGEYIGWINISSKYKPRRKEKDRKQVQFYLGGIG